MKVKYEKIWLIGGRINGATAIPFTILYSRRTWFETKRECQIEISKTKQSGMDYQPIKFLTGSVKK